MPITKPLPLEKIIHRTGSNPFSLHQYLLHSGESCALYLHCHPEAELFLLDEGEILFHVENQNYELQAGDGIFIPPNLIHSADRLGDFSVPCSYRAVVFSPELLERFYASHQHFFEPLYQNRLHCIYPIFSSEACNGNLLRHLQQLLSYREAPADTYELALTGSLLNCWQELYNLRFSHLVIPAKAEHLQSNLQRSLDFIHTHYGEALSLTDLASAAGFSEGYFCHAFKTFTGYAPFTYLNRVRIAKSCDLLLETNKKITDIALLCGFNNISYFNRTFVRMIGKKPTEYRKEN